MLDYCNRVDFEGRFEGRLFRSLQRRFAVDVALCGESSRTSWFDAYECVIGLMKAVLYTMKFEGLYLVNSKSETKASACLCYCVCRSDGAKWWAIGKEVVARWLCLAI